MRALQLGLGPVSLQGGQFKISLGHKPAFVGVQRLESVELKTSRVGGEPGGGQASLGSFHCQRERTFLLANLEGQRFDPSFGGVASGTGRISLL